MLAPQETQPLHLLEALDQPLTRPVTAVVALWKGRVEGVLVLEQSTRRRNSRHHTDAFLLAGRQEVAARFLLENVVDGLHRTDPPRIDCAEAFVAPPDRRPERDSVVAQLALGTQDLQLLEEHVVEDCVHTW